MSTPASRIGTGRLRRQKVFFVADGRRAINDGAHARGGLLCDNNDRARQHQQRRRAAPAVAACRRERHEAEAP